MLKSAAPGPHRWSPFGSLSELRRNPLATLTEARSSYGDVVKFRAGIWHAYLLSRPDDARHVLQENSANYAKGYTFEYLKSVVGRGLLTNEGESWLQQRRLAQPAFHHDHAGEWAEVIVGATARMLGRWTAADLDQPLDAHREMTRLTIEIVSQALFGSGFQGLTPEISGAVEIAQKHVNRQILHLVTIPDRYPTPENRRFRGAMELLDRAVFSIIKGKRELGATSAGDLLSLLIRATDEDTGLGMSDSQLRDEVMTIFLAGHETTACALAWTLQFIARLPCVAERLAAEVDEVLDGRLPGPDDIPRLEYTRMVFEESLRLRPPVWVVGRFARGDDVAGGYRIPGHSSVILSPFVTHRHPDYWDDPERFDPERFLARAVAERPKFAYFPFGGGPRGCIGSEFALMEGVLALALVASYFRVGAATEYEVEPEPLITLRPRGGLPLRFQSRRAWPG